MPTNNKSNQGKQDLPSQRQEKMGERQRSSQQVERSPEQAAEQSRDMSGAKQGSDGRDFDGSQQGKPAPVSNARSGKQPGEELPDEETEQGDNDLQETGRHPSQPDPDQK